MDPVNQPPSLPPPVYYSPPSDYPVNIEDHPFGSRNIDRQETEGGEPETEKISRSGCLCYLLFWALILL